MRPTRNWRHTWCFLCFATEAVYQGVTNVRFDDSEDSYGMIGGTISWTLPENMENVELFMPWLGVDDTAEFQKRATGMSLFNVNNNIYAYAPETEFVARPTNRVPPWPAFFPYNGDEPLLSIQVHTRISGNWQTTEELEEVSKMVIHDLGWTGTSLPITKEDVIFTDQDLRCGFLGGSILISVPSGTDMAMVQSWRVYLSEDLQGNNPSAVSWDLPVSFNAMVTLPADFQQNQSTVLNVAGLTDNGELTLRKPILDDCGGLPDLPFNMSFTDQDPEAEMINGTVSVEIALEYSDQYSSLNFFLALNSTGYGRLYLGQLEPFQTQLQVLTGTRLDSRDHLLAYLNNSYGEQLFPRFLRIQDLSNAAPGASSKVRSMSFTDENQFYGEIAGMVRWVPGSVTVARYFAIYVAQNSSGKNQVQVSPEVPVDQGDEWYINASLDTTGEPYTHLLIYAGNQIGLSAFPQFIPLEDGKVTCQTDSFWPCQRSQVLKDEEDLPLGCQALRCTEEECCADAGTCAAFLNSSANATGCAEGYVPLHAPPEFCARPVCTSSDCCLRSAEPVGNLLLSFNTWDSIQVSWEVPQLHDCVFQEYQVQLALENGTNVTNATWQDAQGCQLKDSCGASCVAQALPSLSFVRVRARVKCLLLGASEQEVYTDWVESSEAIATGRQPPSAPVLMPPAVLLVTEVLYSWTPLESLNLGPDCTFQSWLVQIQEEGTGVWNSVESCLQQSASECLIQGLQCDTDYNVRVAAICQEPELVGEFRTSSFRTETGDVCLRPAATPSGLNATPGAPGSSLQLQWHPGAEPMDCSFFSWELNLRVQGAAEWQSQGCEGGGARENSSCTAGGLQSDTTYEIRIRENCSISSTNSDWSNVASASTHVLSAEVPGLNASVVSYDTVQLYWAQPLLNDCVFSRYQIQWSLQNGTWQDTCQAELSSSCVLGCQVTGLPSRSLVRFRAQVLCVRTVANSGFAVAEVAMPDRLMGAPENVLVAASSSATEVFVSWSSGQLHDCDFQRWQLELYTDATGWQPSEACSFSSPSAQACQLSGLPCDTQFQLRLAGLCGESTGESGFASFGTPDVPGCHAQALPPSWVVGSEATASSVSLTWSPGQEVENCSFLHWEVQVQPENQATYGPAAGCPEASLRNMSSCVVIGLQSATSHTFRVREVCQESTSSSDWAVTSVPISTLLVPAQAPSGLRASEATSSSVTIQWDVPQLNDCHFQGYVLRWRQREGGNWSSSTGCSFFSSSCESTCTANGLPSNAQIDVEVRVSCTQAEAESDWTSASFQTLPVPAGAVVQLSLSEIFTGGGTLSWTPPALNDCALAAYTVELREVFGTWALPSGSCGPSTTPPCSLQGLNCDSNYEVRVAANCTNPLASGPFATVSFTTDVGELCLKQAPAPRSVMATALGVSSLAVAWVDASANASRNCSFSEWQVELRPSSSEGWSSACRVLELQVTDCVASGLPSNTAHHFRVREVCDDVGTWGYTAAAVSTAPVAAAPMVVQASSPQVSQMLVQWSSPELNDCLFSRFKLQWSVDSSSWQEVACGASNFCDSSCSAQSLPSNTAVTFRGRTICTEEALNGEWSNSSVPVSTLPRPSEPLVVHVNVWSYDAAELSWSRPVLNDCILQGWQVELLDSNLWTSGPGCQGLTADATGCNLTNLACDSDFQARVSTRCHSALADAEPRSVSFRTAAGAECLKRAGAPLGVLLLATSVSSATLTWEAGSPNDCTFASWAVQLSPTEPGPSFSCASSLRDSTSCIFSGLAENSSYVASIQELCAESSLASPSALSQVATTFSVPWPSVALQLPFPDETVERRPEELMVMYDVDVELPVVGALPQICALAPCAVICYDQTITPTIRNWRVVTWTMNTSFWQQGCRYDVSLASGFLVTRQKPEKASPLVSWSFLVSTPAAELLRPAEVVELGTEHLSFTVLWSASVDFRCQASSGSVAPVQSEWQLAARQVPGVVKIDGLVPETSYEIQCMARLQDEPTVLSTWLPAGSLVTLKDLDVDLTLLYLRVQPLCASKPIEAYDVQVQPALQSGRANYTVALPNADFIALNCTEQEASWHLSLVSEARSKYASQAVAASSHNGSEAVLTLPEEEVLVTETFTVTVTAGCGCSLKVYQIQVFGLRLRFELAKPQVTKANGDAVNISEVDDGHRLQVVVTYNNDALPAELWNDLILYLGPFPQATLAAPRADLQEDPLSQVYVLLTTISGAGKDLPLELRLGGALVGQAAESISFAAPFVNCISTVGYGQCTVEELENNEVFVGTLGETMLYVKGQGFGSNELLASSSLMRISVTQLYNTTELCEESGWVSYTEMWCRLAPKGASPLVMLLLGPMDETQLLVVPWKIRYKAPVIQNFSKPILQIVDGGQLFIIGQNFPDFQDDNGVVGYESGRRLESERSVTARELQGISTSEVCTSLIRVNQTHLLCEMKPRIDLTPAKCRDVDIVVAWGDLTTEMQTVPLKLPEPEIQAVEDMTPGRPLPIEVGDLTYRLDGINFGTPENGRMQVLVGDRSCEVTIRADQQLFCVMNGPLRDDLLELYPDPPENASTGAIDVVVPISVWVTLGSSSTESSEDCKPIAANWSTHEVHLKSCLAGSMRQSFRSESCVPCMPGWYTPVPGPFLRCQSCPEGSYAFQSASTVCLDCPDGRMTPRNATASPLDCACRPGRFLPLAERRSEVRLVQQVERGEANALENYQLGACSSCPTGATCRGGLEPPVAQPGWWLMPNEVPVRCTMRGCLGNNTCGRGYDQRTRCETCTEQFYVDLPESSCRECESWAVMFGAIYGSLSFLFLFGCVFPFFSWKARVALDPARGVAPPKLCFGLFHCCLKRYAARKQLVTAEYVDMSLYYDKWWSCTRRVLQRFECFYHTPARRLVQGAELQPVVNITINHLQIFFLIANIGYAHWPERIKDILNFGLLMVNSVESLRPSCVAPIGSEGRWYIFFFLPYALYASGIFFVICRQPNRRQRRRIILMISGGFLLYLSPLHLLSASMIFDCVDSAGQLVLDADRGIACWVDPAWYRMFGVAVGGFVFLFIVLSFVALSVYRTYMWYRTAEVGMIPPKSVFFTWWWLSGLRGVSLKHRAAIQGYKVHLDLPKDVTEVADVSSLCDDLLIQNVGNLKSGIERLNEYLQGFRVDDAKDTITRPWRLRGQEVFCEHCQGCGKSMHEKHMHGRTLCGLCSPPHSHHSDRADRASGALLIRSRLREAAYNRLTIRLEHLLMQLRTMSSFSDTQISLKDLLSFTWELIVLVHKTALGLTRLLNTHDSQLGLQLSLLLCIGFLVLSLVVWPYRHNGLNILDSFYAALSVLCVYALIQLEHYNSDQTFFNVFVLLVAASSLLALVMVPLCWCFFALWSSAFSETYYVLATKEVQGSLWRGPSSPRGPPAEESESTALAIPSGKKAFTSILTRVVSSPEELLPDEPIAAQWCFRIPLEKDSTSQRVDLTLQQGIAITVRDPAMLLQILNAEGADVDFQGKWGLPMLPPMRLRRGGDLPGLLRISVPCSDQKLLRSTLKQLNALGEEKPKHQHEHNDRFSIDTEISPRSGRSSVLSTQLFDGDGTPESEMAPRLSTVTTNTQATQATQASVVTQKPSPSNGYKIKALTRPAKIGGRLVPAGAQIEKIRYVPPGTSLEDAVPETPEEFLYRLSRSRFGKGGVLRDAHGVLVLEFQRPDDALDVQLELAELVIARDEVPKEQSAELGLDAPSGMRMRQKVEWARAMYTERAKALVWDVGDFVLPLDLRFTWQVPSLQLRVSPKPDWGSMQQVLVLSRGGQQWILQAHEVHHHLGLAGEAIVKRRRQKLHETNAPMEPDEAEEESDDEEFELDDVFDEEIQVTAVRTGKSSGSRGHFASRSAWRTKCGGVVFIHDFCCYGGTLELVGRPQDIKAVEQGELLGQQVLWHPPERRSSRRPSGRPSSLEEKGDCTCSTVSTVEHPEKPIRGWFDGHNLYWEPTQSFPGHEGEPGSAFDEAVGIPKEGQLPAGPWVRITSAMEPGGIPGPDSGLWTLQTAFYSECYGPLPLEFLEKLGEFQAGPGARELYLRTRRDAMKEDFVEMKVPAEEEPDDWDESSNDEDFSLEALGLVEAIPRQSVAFEDVVPTLKRNSAPRLRTLDS